MFSRKVGTFGSAASIKSTSAKVIELPNEPIAITTGKALNIPIPQRTSLKALKGKMSSIEEKVALETASLSKKKRPFKTETSDGADNNHDEITGPASKRKVTKPVRLADEQLSSPSSALAKQSKQLTANIEFYSSVDPPVRDPTTGELLFPDYPLFRPNMTPAEVMQAGSFGGTYFRPIHSGITGESYTNAFTEFPSEWFAELNIKTQVTSSTYRNDVNTYGVHCGGDLEMWESSGWISSVDPYGWFQWYCRFYLGRRSSDDDRQIARGLGVFGPKGRWRSNLVNKILGKHSGDLAAGLADFKVAPVVRQLLQHWGYRLTLKDLKLGLKKR